jgi:hypothetical protein
VAGYSAYVATQAKNIANSSLGTAKESLDLSKKIYLGTPEILIMETASWKQVTEHEAKSIDDAYWELVGFPPLTMYNPELNTFKLLYRLEVVDRDLKVPVTSPHCS